MSPATLRRLLACASERLVPAARAHGGLALGVLALALGYGPSLTAHLRRAAEPLIFNDDARQQIFPFFSYHEPGLFPDDYLARYYLDCLPIGYRGLYTLGALVWDPAALSKVVPYLLLLATLVALGAAARRLAGTFGALLALTLALSSELLLARLAGGLPRAFAFPILALALAGLTLGRARWLVAAVALGAGFYPAAGVVAGLALGLLLFVLPAQDRGDASAWSFKRRLLVTVGAGLASVVLLLPPLLGSRHYGATLRPADAAQYPELGRGGRYGADDRAPFVSFTTAVEQQASALLEPVGQPWSASARAWATTARDATDPSDTLARELLLASVALGATVLAARRGAGRRLLLLGGAAWAAYLIARPIAPYFYLPQRYAAYPIPLLLLLLLPAAGAGLTTLLPQALRARSGPAAGVLWIALLALPAAGRGSEDAGLNVDVRAQAPLFEFLRTLPKDALIAGWPSDLDSVPYVAKRKVLISYELHQAFHRDFTEQLRHRMARLIDAYFATELGPLQRLRDELGVTHLLVSPRYFKAPPRTFRPFDGWVSAAFRRGQAKGFELPRRLEQARVYADERVVVLDLSRLPR